MSELKAFEVTRKALFGRTCTEKVYLKDEADKVIAEKDKEIAELKDKVREQTSIAEEGWKEAGTYHTSYAEAVKEIAEKDKEIVELKKQVHDYAQGLYLMQARAENQLRHSNYKRCLAIARWCGGRWIRAYHLNKIEKTRFYARWQKRWLELAEKFKPNH